jgi:hypothetical protein
MSDIAANSVELPRSAYFTHTLRRARTAAEQRSHRYVMLEHLLLALLDDPDAQRALKLSGADASSLRVAIADAVNHRMATLVSPGNAIPSFSYKFEFVMQTASNDAARMKRREVDGCFVTIALAKEGRSFAGKLLRQYGLDPARALAGLANGDARTAERRSPPPMNGASAPRQMQAQVPRPAPSLPPLPSSDDPSIEEMLQSVRSLLDEEERKVRGVASGIARPAGRNGAQAAPSPLAARLQAAAPATAQRAPAPAPARPANGAAPVANLPVPYKPPRPDGRSKAAAARLVESVPRAMRVAVPEIIEIRLSKEESAAIVQSLQGRDMHSHKVPVSRTMTLRLRAPKGGFFIETLSPETQWMFDRPSFLDGEPFGRWLWTVIPNERGKHKLQMIVSSRNIDENGLAGDVPLPEQMIEIKVRTNYKRELAQIFRGLLLLLLGGALTEGVLHFARIYLQHYF